jgi:hypothetical protein
VAGSRISMDCATDIVSKQLGELMGDPNPEKPQRILQAMLKMQKVIAADLQKAYVG